MAKEIDDKSNSMADIKRWKMSTLSEIDEYCKTEPINSFLNEALNELEKADLTNIDSSRAAIKRALANLIIFKERLGGIQ